MEAISALSPCNDSPKEAKNFAKRVKNLILGTDSLWKGGVTFRNACDISVLYVTGLIPTSPYHFGPITSESSPLTYKLARCTRNGLLTVSSEPVQSGDINIITGEIVIVVNASVEFWIKKHNVKLLLDSLTNKFDIAHIETCKFSDEFGASYAVEDDYTTRYFITDTKKGTNEIYDLLGDISTKFTEFPTK